MPIFLTYIIICGIVAILPETRINRRKALLVVSCVMLFIVLGCRDISVGNDTDRYVTHFLSYQRKDFIEIFSIGDNYGFYIFNYILSLIAPNGAQFYIMATSLFMVVSIYFFLKRNAEDIILSQAMLLALSFIYFFATGIKQSLAIAILLFSYEYLKRNKFFKFLILVLLAASFHITALVFLLAWPITKFKIKHAYIIIAPVFVGLSYVFRSQIFIFIKNILGDDYFSSYGTSYESSINLTGLAIQTCIFVFSLVCFWNAFDKDNEVSGLSSIYLVGMCFQAMTPIMAEFFRISMYFSIFGVIMLPKAVGYLGIKNKQLVSIALFIVFVMYFILFSGRSSAFDAFKFFWQSY